MALSISTLTRENAETIQKVLEKFETTLHPSSYEDEEVVRRAVFSVRNKSVKPEKYNPKTTTIYCTVQDVKPASVSFSLQSGDITCSCPQEMCRHQLGVTLMLYQYLGSVQDWTAKWRSKKSAALQTLATERSPQSWMRMVHEVTSHLLPKNKKLETYLFANVIDNIHTKLRKYTPLEREWQPVFSLFMEVAVLNKVWTHLIENEQKFTSDYVDFTIQKRINMAKTTLLELAERTQLFAVEPFYDAIQQEVRQLVMQSDGLDVKRYDLYLTAWRTIFNERKRAIAEMKQLSTYTHNNIPLVFAQAVSDAIIHDTAKQGVDAEAPKQMDLLNMQTFESALDNTSKEDAMPSVVLDEAHLVERIDLAVPLAQFLTETGRLERATNILRAILPGLTLYIKSLPRMYREYFCRTVHELYRRIELTQEEQLTLYGAFGRFGVMPYSEYLLSNAMYDEWVALHQLFPSSIPHLEAIGLKEVIDRSPASAMPLYHFYAMEELRQKSRLNYKQAVRIWRAMRNVAKKAGKTSYFEDYIGAIRQQYKRLRALQEELDKANFTA